MIRRATLDDWSAVRAMALAFLAESPYGALFEVTAERPPAALDELLGLVLEAGVVFVADVGTGLVGMLAMGVGGHAISGQRYADEIAWWVHPAHRGGTIGPRLLAAAEAWARADGCTLVKMIAPHHAPDVGRYLARRGYAPVETAHVRRL